MSLGLVGKKQGMTRLFTPEGDSFAVSVVSVDPNTITQIKSEQVDGYNSIQVTTGQKRKKNIYLKHFQDTTKKVQLIQDPGFGNLR